MTNETVPLFSRSSLEHNYNSYAYHGAIAIPLGVAFGDRIIMHIDEIRHIIYLWYEDGAGDYRMSNWQLDTLVNIWTSPAAVNYWEASGFFVNFGGDCSPYCTRAELTCSRNRYVFVLLWSGTDIAIYKDGALIQTINMLLYNPAFTDHGVMCSLSGEWLVVCDGTTIWVFRGAT